MIGKEYEQGDDLSLITYRALRLAPVALVILLGTSLATHVLSNSPACFHRSVSAYHYTAVRPAFVAALFAAGTCLIAYRGNTDVENALLDISGFFAYLVAFVPKDPDLVCGAINVPTAAEIMSTMTNNVLALFITAFVTVIAVRLIEWRHPSPDSFSRSAIWTLGAGTVALLGGFLLFALSPAAFLDRGHGFAAVALFAGFLAVVVVNAINSGHRYRRRYISVALTMAATVVLACIVKGRFLHWIFMLEGLLILEFMWFWILQSAELWDVRSRRELLATVPPAA